MQKVTLTLAVALTLTSKPRVLKKVKKNWSHDLKVCNQSLLRKHQSPLRWEVNWKPLAHQIWNTSATLPGPCCLSDKLTALFELRHARRCGPISFEVRRSMGGSTTTS